MDAEKYYRMAMNNRERTDGDADNELTAKYLGMSADLNYAPAQYELGKCYEYGEGVESDLDRAFLLIGQAALQDYLPAITELASYYALGYGTDKDKMASFKWKLSAARMGDAQSMLAVGLAYSNGILPGAFDDWEGLNPDLEQALFWYKEAQLAGLEEATELFAHMLERVGTFPDQSGKKAPAVTTENRRFEDILSRLQEVNPAGLSITEIKELGAAYKDKSDLENAILLYREGALRLDADCARALAQIYLDEGEGQDEDLAELLTIMQHIAEHDHSLDDMIAGLAMFLDEDYIEKAKEESKGFLERLKAMANSFPCPHCGVKSIDKGNFENEQTLRCGSCKGLIAYRKGGQSQKINQITCPHCMEVFWQTGEIKENSMLAHHTGCGGILFYKSRGKHKRFGMPPVKAKPGVDPDRACPFCEKELDVRVSTLKMEDVVICPHCSKANLDDMNRPYRFVYFKSGIFLPCENLYCPKCKGKIWCPKRISEHDIVDGQCSYCGETFTVNNEYGRK